MWSWQPLHLEAHEKMLHPEKKSAREPRGHRSAWNMKEVVKRTEACHLVFLTLNVGGPWRCVMSPGLAPRVGMDFTQREGGDGVPHLLKWPQHRALTCNASSVFRGVFFSQGWEAAWWLTFADYLKSVAIIYVHIQKSFQEVFISFPWYLHILLCRDIGLAAKSFLPSRSKCQVWFSQQAQLNGLSTSSHKQTL